MIDPGDVATKLLEEKYQPLKGRTLVEQSLTQYVESGKRDKKTLFEDLRRIVGVEGLKNAIRQLLDERGRAHKRGRAQADLPTATVAPKAPALTLPVVAASVAPKAPALTLPVAPTAPVGASVAPDPVVALAVPPLDDAAVELSHSTCTRIVAALPHALKQKRSVEKRKYLDALRHVIRQSCKHLPDAFMVRPLSSYEHILPNQVKNAIGVAIPVDETIELVDGEAVIEFKRVLVVTFSPTARFHAHYKIPRQRLKSDLAARDRAACALLAFSKSLATRPEHARTHPEHDEHH